MRPFKYFSILFILILFTGCGSDLPIEKKITSSYSLLDQDSIKVIFPDDYKGKLVVVGFIFTNCPDICPLTINNLQQIQNDLKKQRIDNVEVLAISFDPLRDTPSILKLNAKVRGIKTDNFHFLTGKQKEIDSLMSAMGITAFTDDTTYTKSGEPIYFFVHTDRISLMDEEGQVRGEYSGSRVKASTVINDIKTLR